MQNQLPLSGKAIMNKSALIMMVLSMILLWGGLLAAMVHLSRHPDDPEIDHE